MKKLVLAIPIAIAAIAIIIILIHAFTPEKEIITGIVRNYGN